MHAATSSQCNAAFLENHKRAAQRCSEPHSQTSCTTALALPDVATSTPTYTGLQSMTGSSYIGRLQRQACKLQALLEAFCPVPPPRGFSDFSAETVISSVHASSSEKSSHLRAACCVMRPHSPLAQAGFVRLSFQTPLVTRHSGYLQILMSSTFCTSFQASSLR